MILVLDFGGQYNQLIARRVRENHVYCEVHPQSLSLEKIREMAPKGIILTGGPNSVYTEDAVTCSPEIFELGIPVLGICYGMQLMSYTLGGKVGPSTGGGEYGRIRTRLTPDCPLFDGVPDKGMTLMSHGDVNLILATGGSAMVRSAYQSGTPAIGVGPGNGPAYLERTCDLPLAVKRIMDSKTFDYGLICASEQSVICDEDMAPAVQAEMEKQGAYFLSEAESKKLGAFILRANGTMNPAIVGHSVQKICELAGLTTVPAGTRVLVAHEDGVGRGHPYSNEKLAPILAFFTAKDYKAVCERAIELLNYEGAGHTFSIHTKNDEIVDYFASRVPASRILVNTPSALGGIGCTTGLAPALTLGCGAVGGSATSENVSPMLLLNQRYVAYGLREIEEVRKDVPECESSAGQSCGGSVTAGDVEAIVKQVLAKLQAF